MSDTYTATGASFSDTITQHEDGEPSDSASAHVIDEALLENDVFLRNKVFGRYYDAEHGTIVNPNTRFSGLFTIGTPVMGWMQSNITDQGSLLFKIPNLPPGGVITAFRVVVEGGGGSAGDHAALPATLPTARLYRLTLSTGVFVELADPDDASGTQAAYDAIHNFEMTGLGEVISDGLVYFAAFLGESGANSQANSLLLHALRVFVAAP